MGVAERIDLTCSHPKKEMVCGVVEVLTNTAVVIIVQYMCIKSITLLTLKVTQCYMWVYLSKVGGKNWRTDLIDETLMMNMVSEEEYRASRAKVRELNLGMYPNLGC